MARTNGGTPGEVEGGDAVVEGEAHYVLAAGEGGGFAEIVPESERYLRQEDAAAPAARVAHAAFVAVVGSFVDCFCHVGIFCRVMEFSFYHFLIFSFQGRIVRLGCGKRGIRTPGT